MKFLLFVLFTLTTLPGIAIAQPFFAPDQDDPKPDDKKWVAVENLSDEFSGSALDKTKWHGDPGVKGWGWVGRPPGLFKEDSIAIEDGKMNITVGVLDEPVTINGNEFKYHGAIIRSVNPGKVGDYFECRMKANHTEMSSTFWLITPHGVEPRLELDIQECVGKTSDLTKDWARSWDQIFHSNTIVHFKGDHEKRIQIQNSVKPKTKNWQQFYVYAAWWKSPREIQFYLDGKLQYTIDPTVDWDQPSYIQMAIETYDWNPVPEDGGLIAHSPLEQRKTQYDWVRTWRLE